MCCSSLVYSQNHTHDSSGHNHDHATHQDSSYHCASCNHHLFDAEKATPISSHVLHYHGVATDNTQTAIHCKGCSSHLGYYNHQHSLFQVIGDKVGQEEETTFHCLACLLPLFEEQSLFTSNKSFHYFSTPIDKKRIALAERNQFYKKQADSVKCRNCDAAIGKAHSNHSGGFGLRLNLKSVKRQKKN